MNTQKLPVADKPARITEQDVREIAESCLAYWLYKHPMEFHVGDWLSTRGRELLNKLNADREQVPAVATPEITTAMYMAGCRAYHENLPFKSENVEVIFKAMLEAAQSHSQQSAVPDGLVEALVQSQFQVDADGTFIGVSRQALDEAIEIIRSLSIPSHSHALKVAGDRLEREILTVPLPEPADLVVSALVEALEEARLTLEVMQGRGSSVTLTLAIIDRALASYRKGEKS